MLRVDLGASNHCQKGEVGVGGGAITSQILHP